MPELRALKNTERPMQRLGFLKRVVHRAGILGNANIDNLGKDLVDTVTRRFNVNVSSALSIYIRHLRNERVLKASVNEWAKSQPSTSVVDVIDAPEPNVAVELQDLYLADPTLPSQVGKLVRANWDLYPRLAVNIGLLRAGTFSPNTRAVTLLRCFTPEVELSAFLEYKPEANPLRINREQSLLFLYSLLESDGDVIAPLWAQLATTESDGFTDREVGDHLPEVFQLIVKRYRNRSQTPDVRERLTNLERWRQSIERERTAGKYGAGSREHASRVRVEPYVDVGLLLKSDPFKLEYLFSTAGIVWANAIKDTEADDQIEEFIKGRFFATAAKAWGIQALPLMDVEVVIRHLYRAWEKIHSPGGYAPIEELGLAAGIFALIEDSVELELRTSREAIMAYQRTFPYRIRLTVNRSGVLAHARFLESPLSPNSAK